MEHECSIVRDLLPLYVEGMVSEETAAFVRGHLQGCEACAAECARLQKPIEVPPAVQAQTVETDISALKRIKKKLKLRLVLVSGLVTGCLLVGLFLLYRFPVYRYPHISYALDMYNPGEVAMLISAGSAADRATAQAVLRQADAAFEDCVNDRETQRELYGELSRYAVAGERGAVEVDYSLELWSAHFFGERGCLWVYYSMEALDAQGETVTGSWGIPSLWYVEKDESGTWHVVDIKEHP